MEKKELIERIFDARNSRRSHPAGEFDRAGRWRPDEMEECECCKYIRNPSRRFSYSLLRHCRSKRHVRNLVEKRGCDDPALLVEARKGGVRERTRPRRACADGVAYKQLAIGEDGRLYSVYDGSPWVLGVERRQVPRQGHNGGFYVYESLNSAKYSAGFPKDSKLRHAARVVVKCEVKGRYCKYNCKDPWDNRPLQPKLAFERVTPLNVVEML